jgi:hypothetical protein
VSNPYIRALVHYWYLLVLGLAAGIIAAVLVVDTVKLGVPPKLHPRSKPTYQAQAQMLVDTPKSSFFLTKKSSLQAKGYHYERGTAVTTKGGTTHVPLYKVPDGKQVVTDTPDFKTITFYANLYPSFVTSDAVMKIRAAMYPKLPKNGTLAVQALGASLATGGRLRTSPLPIDVITATAHSPAAAIQLAEATAVAFRAWVADQTKGTTQADNPVTIRLLTLPQKAVNTTSSRTSIAALVGLVVFAAFAGLAILLARSRRRPAPVTGTRRVESFEDEDALLEEELRRLRETTRTQ